MEPFIQAWFGQRGRPEQWYLPGTDPVLLPWPAPGLPDPMALSGGPYADIDITAPFAGLVTAEWFDPMSNRVGITFTVAGGWNSVKNAAVRSDWALDVRLDGFVHGDVILGLQQIHGGTLGSWVRIDGAKRGNVATGGFDDLVHIAMLSNEPTWGNEFRISAGAGTDTVILRGLDEAWLGSGPYRGFVDTSGEWNTSGSWTRSFVDLGPGRDRFLGHGSADTVTGGAGNDTGVGGPGHDVWQLRGRPEGYRIEARGTDTFIVDIDPRDGDDGRDQIRGFEEIRFADGISIALPQAPGIAPLALAGIAAGAGGFKIAGSAPGFAWRHALGGSGDVNGDGLADLLIGTEKVRLTDWRVVDAVWQIVFGKPDGGAIDIENLTPDQGLTIRSTPQLPIRQVAMVGDINADGIADFAVRTDRAVLIAFGSCDGQIDLAGIAAGTSPAGFRIPLRLDEPGFTIRPAGDVNGDGLGDLLIGPLQLWQPSRIGTFFVVFGQAENRPVDLVSMFAGRSTDGFAVRGQFDITFPFGRPDIVPVGDVNGDGLADLMLSAPGSQGGGIQQGLFIVFGKADGAPVLAGGHWITPGAGFAIRPDGRDGAFNYAIDGAGDVNGDGLADLLLGTWQQDEPVRDGRAYVVFGKADGRPVRLADLAEGRSHAGFAIHGEPGALTGRTVAGVGDLNDDGLDDLLIGNERGGSIAAVVFGQRHAGPIDLFAIDTHPADFAFGLRPESSGGTGRLEVAAAGDVNGDGRPDMLLLHKSWRNESGVYVVFGREVWPG